MSKASFDLIVFGATSFVGQILTRYLWASQENVRWAIAGRSEEKLIALRDSLEGDASALPLLVADSRDRQSLLELCNNTKVIISTVGPYALYGDLLVQACVESGTDYCDLTGEVLWMKQMIEKHQVAAQRTGARIVHCCGFDSIPSDLGVYFCQQQAMRRFGQYCTNIKMRVKTLRGSFSGGTVASMINGVKLVVSNPELRDVMRDPYAICPPSTHPAVTQHNVSTEYDSDCQSWAAPFVMAGINTRVVFRTNALLDYLYGREFYYDEATLTGGGASGKWRSRLLRLGLGFFAVAIVLPPTRWLLQRFVLPKPGEGPSQEVQENGRYDLHFIGRTSDGLEMRTQVTGDRDPGYGSTAKMLAQAGLCLAFDVGKQEIGGGFWTPATALNHKLIKRLEEHAGLTFTVLK